MERVTIQHVAERAGVSSSTVSRTLHNHPRISEETKQRVLEAVRALNYRSSIYQGSQELQSIGVILPNSSRDPLTHPFFSELLRGISTYLQSRGYFTLYGYSCEEDETLDMLGTYVRSDAVCGVILLAVHSNDRRLDFLSHQDVPFAVVGRPEKTTNQLWVDNDNFHAMYDVVNLLVEDGARRIAFLGGPPEMTVTRDRLHGYQMALANRGMAPGDGLTGFTQTFSEEAGYKALVPVLSGGPLDAVVTTDDFLSLGALRALTERGLGQVPCVGFNNMRLVLDHVPELASVEIFPDRLGQEAARLIIEVVEDGAPSENHVIVPTQFVGSRLAPDQG